MPSARPSGCINLFAETNCAPCGNIYVEYLYGMESWLDKLRLHDCLKFIIVVCSCVQIWLCLYAVKCVLIPKGVRDYINAVTRYLKKAVP